MAAALPIGEEPSVQGGNYRRGRCASCNTFRYINLHGLAGKHKYISQAFLSSRKPFVSENVQKAPAPEAKLPQTLPQSLCLLPSMLRLKVLVLTFRKQPVISLPADAHT